MSLVTVAYTRAHIQTDLDDTTLQTIIDDEESEVIRRCGAHGDGVTAVTETIAGGNGAGLFLSRPFVSITSVTANGSAIAAGAYTAYASQGYLSLLSGGSWLAPVVVSYVPVDDRARRRLVLIELIRLHLEQTAMKGESIGGEYSYSAPDDWEAKRAALYRRLLPPSL